MKTFAGKNNSLSLFVANFEQCLAASHGWSLKIFNIYKDIKQNDKSRLKKVKSIENEEIIMAMLMTQIII